MSFRVIGSNRLLHRGNLQLNIQSFCETKHQDITSVSNRLIDFALGAMNHITARFEQDSATTYKLHCDSLNADLGVGMTMTQIAGATKGDNNFDADLSHKLPNAAGDRERWGKTWDGR